ncbi:hypothetical protein U5640_15940 [Streptomyces sp. SS7]|uniref:hypothetical protein n=1 Tax=Streptomyces sp. SS7 TaxID=3108485 RepID=UPI0030ED55E1
MGNRNKERGTKAETAVVNWLRGSCGFVEARRNALGGRFDPGDVEPIPAAVPPVIISVKDGAEGAYCPNCRRKPELGMHTALFRKWWFDLAETVERRSPLALPLLVHKRAGAASPERWKWYVDSAHMGRYRMGPIGITGAQARYLMQRHIARWAEE